MIYKRGSPDRTDDGKSEKSDKSENDKRHGINSGQSRNFNLTNKLKISLRHSLSCVIRACKLNE